MKTRVLPALLTLSLLPGVVFSDPPSLPGLKRQVDQLAAIVNVLQEDLAKTREELKLAKNELAAVKSNTVLGLDGLLALTQDANGYDTAVFSGVNVQVVNGTGATDAANGRGNLVLGYNMSNGAFVDRLGSHNVVLGDDQAYSDTQVMVTGKILSNRDLALTVANNLNTEIGADQHTTVGNNRTVVTGRNNSESIGNTASVNVGSNAEMTVGNSMNLNIGQDMAFTIARNAEISVGNTATVDAADELLMMSGSASSLLKKNGDIGIEGKDISVKGSGGIDIKAGADLVLKGARILQN